MSTILQERNLTGFDWLPLARWNVDTILTFTEHQGKKNCKVCSEWVDRTKQESHVKKHVKEREELLARDKAVREAERIVAKAEKRLEQAITKAPATSFYTIPCRVCSKGIRRTGRRGRPPLVHDECKADYKPTIPDEDKFPTERVS